MGPTHRRVNLYGPPLQSPETLDSVKQIGRRVGSIYAGTNHTQSYLNCPHMASTYRGRVLVADRVEDHPPPKHLKDKVNSRGMYM